MNIKFKVIYLMGIDLVYVIPSDCIDINANSEKIYFEIICGKAYRDVLLRNELDEQALGEYLLLE